MLNILSWDCTLVALTLEVDQVASAGELSFYEDSRVSSEDSMTQDSSFKSEWSEIKLAWTRPKLFRSTN